MKDEFSFKALTLRGRVSCHAAVAASVRKSHQGWVTFRLDQKTKKLTNFKPGVLVAPFIDEKNRALLFLADQRPVPATARPVCGKDHSVVFELPRQEILAEWFEIGPMRPMILIEASHNRLVIQVPKKSEH